MMICSLQRLTVIAVLAAAVWASPARAGSYAFTNFDGPGDITGGTTVNGISNTGVVVGFTQDAGGNFNSFIRNPDGTFAPSSFVQNDQANGVNTDVTVVGGTGTSAFSYSAGVTTPIPSVNGTTTSEVAFGINDKGVIVGQFTDSNTGKSPGFIDNGGTFTTIDPNSANFVNAQGINNNGLVVGFYSDDNLHSHGFLYDTMTQKLTLLADPNVANFEFSQVLGINDNGLAVGYYQTNDGSQHGYLYNTVTKSYTFLDDPNAMPGTGITQITGIADSGEIAGFYVDPNTGVNRGFVATPTPEPGSIVLMGLGVLSVVGYQVRRRRQAA